MTYIIKKFNFIMQRIYFNGDYLMGDAGFHYGYNVGLTQRVISMLRKDIDKAIVYEQSDTVKLVKWYIDNDYLNSHQIVFIPYTRPDDVHYSSNIILELIDILKDNVLEWEFVIGNVTDEIYHFIQSWIKKYSGHILKDMTFPLKNSLYHSPKLDIPPNYIENALIPRLRGFWCRDKEDLVQAYENLKSLSVTEFVIKPISTSSGTGITFFSDISDMEYYSFQYGDIVLEEKANLRNIFPAYHFEGNISCGELCSQILDGSEFIGVTNLYPIENDIMEAADRTKNELLKTIELEGFWGVDLLVIGSTVYVNDINTGRINGSHSPKYIIQNHYKPDTKFVMRAITTRDSLDALAKYDPVEFLRSIEPDVFNYVDMSAHVCKMIPIIHSSEVEKYNCRLMWVFIEI